MQLVGNAILFWTCRNKPDRNRSITFKDLINVWRDLQQELSPGCASYSVCISACIDTREATQTRLSHFSVQCPNQKIRKIVAEHVLHKTLDAHNTSTGAGVVSAEKQSPPLPSLRAHCSRFSNYFMINRQSTCKYTIAVQFTDFDKLLLHNKYGNGGDCFPAETTFVVLNYDCTAHYIYTFTLLVEVHYYEMHH
jgi:hypothetical protein